MAVNKTEGEWRDKDAWISEKPIADKEFLMISSVKIRGVWDYNFWQIIKVSGVDNCYYALCDHMGEEYMDYEDLKADFYLPLPPKK